MTDRVREAILVIEHHRALFRLKYAKTEAERCKYREEVKLAESNLSSYMESINGKRVQDDKKADNTGKARPTLCFVRRADKESGRPEPRPHNTREQGR